jgi:hypothetical protein
MAISSDQPVICKMLKQQCPDNIRMAQDEGLGGRPYRKKAELVIWFWR